MDHSKLKARQRAERDRQPVNLSVRVHRALSWLARAEQAADDTDARFIFLWIAFNAAYAAEIDDRPGKLEREVFRAFIQRLLDLDNQRLIQKICRSESFRGGAKRLIENQHLFPEFWGFVNERIDEATWKGRFQASRKAASDALAKRDVAVVLSVLLNRIYVLRNQIMHGGSTWNGSINRPQLRDATSLMAKVVPAVISIMMDNVQAEWAEPVYPVVDK